MSDYPDRHHPVFFLIDALKALGAEAVFVKDMRTLDCWGLQVNGKLAVWLIDNRWQHEAIKEDPAASELLSRNVLVMCAQKPDAVRVNGKWLPLAATPGYRPARTRIAKLVDVAMVGYVRDAARAELLRHAARHFTICIAQGVFGQSALDTYWSARVGLNVPTQFGNANAWDINMRVFEILATGVPLVTNYLPELAELGIVDDFNCLLYHDAQSAVQAIQRALDNGEQIGVNGAKLAADRHTYAQRAKTVLEWLR